VREDPQVKGLLYAGTETGIYFSLDDGAHWQSLQLNLPTTPIHDLALKNSDLVAATHGRSFWILDDVSPLRQASAKITNEEFHFYQPAPATRLHFPDQVERRRPVGDNPPKGAIFYYFLKEKPTETEEITLDIFDAQGKRVRHLSNRQENKNEQPPEWPDLESTSDLLPAEAGLNRFAWDFRYDPPLQVPVSFYEGEPPRGPLVLPGTYQVKLTVKGHSQTESLDIVLDPRVKDRVTNSDLQEQLDLALNTRQDIDTLHRSVNQIRALRANLKTLETWTKESSPNNEVIAAAKALDDKMTKVEEQLIQVKLGSSEGNLRYPNMLNEEFASLSDLIESFDQAPTAQQLQVYEDLHKRLDGQLQQWREIEHTDLPALNESIRKNGVPSLSAGSGKGD
jgi:hypothetical protein